MKILCIPDIHQHIEGIKYAENHVNDFDKIVFLGDYVDDWHSLELWDDNSRNPLSIIERVCNLKNKSKNIKLLLGNHDLAYISSKPSSQNISGHQKIHHESIRKSFIDNIDNFDIVYKIDGWLFSHAGVSDVWLGYIEEKYNLEEKLNTTKAINKLFHDGFWDIFDFCGGVKLSVSYDGDNQGESPLWIRPSSLITDSWRKFNDMKNFKGQIVGHTEVGQPPLILKNMDDKYLIVIDSRDHDCYFELNTKKTKYSVNPISYFI